MNLLRLLSFVLPDRESPFLFDKAQKAVPFDPPNRLPAGADESQYLVLKGQKNRDWRLFFVFFPTKQKVHLPEVFFSTADKTVLESVTEPKGVADWFDWDYFLLACKSTLLLLDVLWACIQANLCPVNVRMNLTTQKMLLDFEPLHQDMPELEQFLDLVDLGTTGMLQSPLESALILARNMTPVVEKACPLWTFRKGLKNMVDVQELYDRLLQVSRLERVSSASVVKNRDFFNHSLVETPNDFFLSENRNRILEIKPEEPGLPAQTILRMLILCLDAIQTSIKRCIWINFPTFKAVDDQVGLAPKCIQKPLTWDEREKLFSFVLGNGADDTKAQQLFHPFWELKESGLLAACDTARLLTPLGPVASRLRALILSPLNLSDVWNGEWIGWDLLYESIVRWRVQNKAGDAGAMVFYYDQEIKDVERTDQKKEGIVLTGTDATLFRYLLATPGAADLLLPVLESSPDMVRLDTSSASVAENALALGKLCMICIQARVMFDVKSVQYFKGSGDPRMFISNLRPMSGLSQLRIMEGAYDPEVETWVVAATKIKWDNAHSVFFRSSPLSDADAVSL